MVLVLKLDVHLIIAVPAQLTEITANTEEGNFEQKHLFLFIKIFMRRVVKIVIKSYLVIFKVPRQVMLVFDHG